MAVISHTSNDEINILKQVYVSYMYTKNPTDTCQNSPEVLSHLRNLS